ncbi:PREDICTED: axonemal 84 kDa protein-like [Papilio polytes]|uniref:axonemal 84 kDa protein-like n=1 Tax=Papilio polytes TaxID=76194 RepID=UPI0006760051|nr:PREDICTED: axonemal 84 kDa protein-like [Papilio polytes]
MAKKDKKKNERQEPPEAEVLEETLVAATDLEQPPEEVQYTDTSYTSASFESLPPPVEEVKPKKKKGKKGKVEEVVVAKKTTSMFDWSDESIPDEQEPPVEEEEDHSKSRKRGKKGKKDKKKEEIPEFEKPPNWRKMNKKDRDNWLLQRIEEWRAEKEAEKQAILAGAKEKRLAEARARAALMVKDKEQMEVRGDLLRKTVILFQKYEQQKLEFEKRKNLRAEWHQYLRCDGLPDPRIVTQMNTYLHLWRQQHLCDDNDLDRRCLEVLPMLDLLDEITADTRQYTDSQIRNFNEVRMALREELSNAIQVASYTLLRDLEHHFQWPSIKLSTYEREFKGLRLNFWVAVRMPTRKPKPVEPEPEPVELTFPAMKVAIKLPKIIDGSCACVRAARSLVDLLSERSRTFPLTLDINNKYEDLYTFNIKEHEVTYKLKVEQDEVRTKFYKDIAARIKEIETFIKSNPFLKNEKEKEELDNLNMAEPQGLPDPRTYFIEQNELAFTKYLKKCAYKTRPGEINLRKYRVCGGILNVDLLTTPPQAKRMARGIALTTLELPKQLQQSKYQVRYRAPSPPPPGVTRTPEEIEAEIKRVEAEYENLALVFIELPQDVMWSEPPVVCQWYEPRHLWMTTYINDYKFNEDKLTVQFRTGVLWPIGFATLRYSNLPYQGWDIRPDLESEGVVISVTGVCVSVTWLCRGSSVRLLWIANATTPALKDHFHKPYSVKKMIQIMREAACDFFPDFDAHNQVEGSCPKEWVGERHTYHAMAFLSRAYNFQWSRWNATAGSRNLVMQIREAVDRKREAKFSLLHATPQHATILNCTELSQEFNLEPLAGLQFYPDLFTLNLSYGSVDARRAPFLMKYRLVETVFNMLTELKLCSFS